MGYIGLRVRAKQQAVRQQLGRSVAHGDGGDHSMHRQICSESPKTASFCVQPLRYLSLGHFALLSHRERDTETRACLSTSFLPASLADLQNCRQTCLTPRSHDYSRWAVGADD